MVSLRKTTCLYRHISSWDLHGWGVINNNNDIGSFLASNFEESSRQNHQQWWVKNGPFSNCAVQTYPVAGSLQMFTPSKKNSRQSTKNPFASLWSSRSAYFLFSIRADSFSFTKLWSAFRGLQPYPVFCCKWIPGSRLGFACCWSAIIV